MVLRRQPRSAILCVGQDFLFESVEVDQMGESQLLCLLVFGRVLSQVARGLEATFFFHQL